MRKPLLFAYILLCGWLFFSFFSFGATDNLQALPVKDCRMFSPADPLELPAAAGTRLLRLRARFPEETSASLDGRPLNSPRLFPARPNLRYFLVPPGSSGTLTLNPPVSQYTQACTMNYLSYAKGAYLLVFADFPAASRNGASALASIALALLPLFLSALRSPAASALASTPLAAVCAASLALPSALGIQARLSGDFFLSLLWLSVSAAGAWALRRHLKRGLQHLLLPSNWPPPDKFELWLWPAAAAALISLCYSPMLTHIFRHDEWFYFFTFREAPAPVLKYIDWQVFLPSDRLIFRPLHHGMLAANMLLFGGNYVAPHVLSLMKHLAVSALVLVCLWNSHPHRLAFLAAALFGLLATQIDPVAWAHVDAYIVSTALVLGATLLFFRAAEGRSDPRKGFGLSALLLLLAMLTTELAFPAPLIMFSSYWMLFRKPGLSDRRADAAVWFYALPFAAWAVLFGLHLWSIYPDFSMSSQSSRASLADSFTNALMTSALNLFRIFPVFTSAHFSDKIYSATSLYWYSLCAAALMAAAVRWGKALQLSRRAVFYSAMSFAPWLMVAIARSSYLEAQLSDLLPGLWTSTHYSYMPNAFMVAALYELFWRPMAQRPRFYAALLAILCAANAALVYTALRRAGEELEPFRRHYDQLKLLVAKKGPEPDFSFKLVRRQEISAPFNWYAASFPETFYGSAMSNSSPKYLAEYDPSSGRLDYWPAAEYPGPKSFASWSIGLEHSVTDLINTKGMRFMRLPLRGRNIYAGISEVTAAQWQRVMGDKPRAGTGDAPAAGVSFLEASEFVRRLNEAEKTRAYRLPSGEERDAMWLLTLDLASHKRWSGEPAGNTGERHTVCGWLAGSVTSEKYTYPDTPRLCSGLRFKAGGAPHIYESAYPPDYYFHDTGLRVIRDFIPR